MESPNPYNTPHHDPRRSRRATQQTTIGVIATIWGVLGWIEYLVTPQAGQRPLAEILTAPQWLIFFVVCSVATIAGPVLVTRSRRPLLYLFFLAPTSYVVFQLARWWG